MLIIELWQMFKEYLLFAVLGIGILIILFSIIYFLIYQKVLNGRKPIQLKSAATIILFVGYLLMVFCATWFSRRPSGYYSVSLSLFSSYLEAWNSFTLRSWQLLILNIVVFVPFGILLPLVSKRFQNLIWIISAGAVFTLSIETIQWVFRIGVFEADDLLNNLIGVIVGYGMVMAVLSAVNREKRISSRIIIGYLMPLLLVIVVYSGIFIKYSLNDLGNLAAAYSQRINCDNVQISSVIDLSQQSNPDVVYKTKVYNKKTGLEYAKQIYEGMGVSTGRMNIIQYNNNAIYQSYGEGQYSLWVKYAGGQYDFTDFSYDQYQPAAKTLEQKTVLKALEKMNIYVPENLDFTGNEQDGQFSFKADMIKNKNKYLLGQLDGTMYEDGIIRNLNNNLTSLEKYKAVSIISEAEAFEKIQQGKFKLYWNEELKSITVKGVKIEYLADSKGYYQPVYCFKAIINEKEYSIVVPAMK